MSVPDAPREASSDPAERPAKRRSPIERVIVWGGIAVLLIVLGIEAHAKMSYEATLASLQATIKAPADNAPATDSPDANPPVPNPPAVPPAENLPGENAPAEKEPVKQATDEKAAPKNHPAEKDQVKLATAESLIRGIPRRSETPTKDGKNVFYRWPSLFKQYVIRLSTKGDAVVSLETEAEFIDQE